MSTINSLVCVFAALVVPLVLGYDEKFDKIDVDKIIGDPALFDGYMNCLLSHGPCTLENSEDFKRLLPEVIATACEKCTPTQKVLVRKSVKAIQEKKPDKFQEFRKMYDPSGEHEAKFSAFLLASD